MTAYGYDYDVTANVCGVVWQQWPIGSNGVLWQLTARK